MLSAGSTEAVRSSAARAAWCGWTAASIRSGRARCSCRLGSGAASLTGNSRAAQWMVLDQLVDEARGPASRRLEVRDAHAGGPQGRSRSSSIVAGLMVFSGQYRASTSCSCLRWSKGQNVRVAVSAGPKAWEVADKLAVAKVR
jgi:hypothetical protein